MADIHHDPSPHGVKPHAIAGTVVGIVLLLYLLAVVGQAFGLLGL